VDYLEIAAGTDHSMALRTDGVAVAWGDNQNGQCNVPAPPPGVMYTTIGAGNFNGYAARGDLVLSAWEHNVYGQCDVPAIPDGIGWRQVDGGFGLAAGLRSDGKLEFWGTTQSGPIALPEEAPAGLIYKELAAASGVVAVRIGSLSDGGSLESVCAGAPNSVSRDGALLEVHGTPSCDANDLVLSVSGLPSSATGTFVYGPVSPARALGNGTLCVGEGALRIQAPLKTGLGGRVSLPIDLKRAPFASGSSAILPGSSWTFQYLYRDEVGGVSTLNLSNAVQIVFAP